MNKRQQPRLLKRLRNSLKSPKKAKLYIPYFPLGYYRNHKIVNEDSCPMKEEKPREGLII